MRVRVPRAQKYRYKCWRKRSLVAMQFSHHVRIICACASENVLVCACIYQEGPLQPAQAKTPGGAAP